MRNKLAVWHAIALSMTLVLGAGCGSSALPGAPGSAGTGGTDARRTADAATETPAHLPEGGTDPAGAAAGDGAAPDVGLGEDARPDLGAEVDAAPARDGGLPPASDAATVDTTGGPTDARVPGDAAMVPDGDGLAGDSGSSQAAYACTLVIGIQATEEWYSFGFETMVDNSKWELIWVHSGFVELWADPNDPVWSTAVTSPCAQNPGKPDRVIFLALNFDYNTLAQWTPVITSSVANLKAKYPSAKRIELMSFIRAPGNNPCPQAPAKRSTITPAQDDAMAMAAAADPGLVVVAPKFEAKSCSEFNSNPPHPSPAGVTAWVKMMADYYR